MDYANHVGEENEMSQSSDQNRDESATRDTAAPHAYDIGAEGVEAQVGQDDRQEATATQDAETTRRIAHERAEANGTAGHS